MAELWKERTLLLLGEEKMQLLESASVAVIGLGGVGAYTAEMLARAGVGNLILLDSDNISETNKNRQLLALDSTIGEKKISLMEKRIKEINNKVIVTVVEEFLTPENIVNILDKYKIDFLVDAIDTLSPKIALICYCVDSKIPHVSSMGAGAKLDATKIRITDISKSFNCPLAYIIRKKLRKYGINNGFKVVFSEELPNRESIIPVEEQNKKSQVGTISYLPAVFGCICAQATIEYLIEKD
ncbi:MAG: tRNA threonylcarbamoyladenosine dehydratase [Bacteroidales bacterium]|nr:tRNA threonylcarbamoyladenosine dehydratase [Bacteroidales bacterium]